MNKKIHTEVNIGIDTSQTQLDIYVRPCGDYFSVENTPKGAKEAACRLRSYQPTRVLIEATGRLEMHFVCAAHEADLPDFFGPLPSRAWPVVMPVRAGCQ